MKRSDLACELTELYRNVTGGCSNNGCVVAKKGDTFVGTNGICQCKPNKVSERLLYLASELENQKEW